MNQNIIQNITHLIILSYVRQQIIFLSGERGIHPNTYRSSAFGRDQPDVFGASGASQLPATSSRFRYLSKSQLPQSQLPHTEATAYKYRLFRQYLYAVASTREFVSWIPERRKREKKEKKGGKERRKRGGKKEKGEG